MNKDWTDKDGDTLSTTLCADGLIIWTSHDGGFCITPTIARDIAKALTEWADQQPIEAIIGKRYLTRDWEVVKYDGTQDVVARVWRNKPGRFDPDEMVFEAGRHNDPGWITSSEPTIAAGYSGKMYFVRVSDLPDDMKQGKR